MSDYTQIRDALTGTAVGAIAGKLGVQLPAREKSSKPAVQELKVNSAPTFMQELGALTKKYQWALGIAAVLGVLIIVEMRS